MKLTDMKVTQIREFPSKIHFPITRITKFQEIIIINNSTFLVLGH